MEEVAIYSLLHVHFESALRALMVTYPDRLHDVRAVTHTPAYRHAQPAERLGLLWRQVTSLTEHEDIFHEQTFRQSVRQLLADMAASRVEHVDLRIGLSTGRWRWMHSATDGLDIFREELRGHRGLSLAFLAAVNLAKPDDQLDALFDVLLDADVTSRIAGVDLNFQARDLPKLDHYLDRLRHLRAAGLKLNIHLGELFANEVSRYVLSRIIPDRIGHGVLLLRDRQLTRIIQDHGICLDMCPTSNTVLGVVDWTRESPARHALRLGIPVSINTDDPMLFGSTIAQELRLAGLTPEEHNAVVTSSRKHRYGNS